jgi:excinuclease ABC subunit C
VRPDLVLIDGGQGQVNAAAAALADLGLAELPLLGVSKGEERRVGNEQLVFADERDSLQLGAEHPALLLIQEIRDEAHRFAVSGHRGRREKARRVSVLEDIDGVGPARRRTLIKHFGGLQGVREATLEQLAAVPGIGRSMAEKIYQILHS